MSGTPTEAEVQDQWRKAIDIVEQTRVFADGLCGDGEEFYDLLSALEGEFTPDALASWAASFRAGLSSMVDGSVVYDAIAPCVLEYGQVLKSANATGSNYETVPDLMRAIYEHFAGGLERVETRALALDIDGAKVGTGNGEISRLITDENDHMIEACHVERKVFRCRRDQNSGTKEYAEVFELIGVTRSRDNLLLNSFGSGGTLQAGVRNSNAGTGEGGSMLKNSSFSSYDTANDNDFTGWEYVAGTVPTQDLAVYYPSIVSTPASAVFSTTGRIKQSLSDLRRGRLNPNRPYFLRAMVRKDSGVTASGGNFIMHLGSRSVSQTILGLAAGWNEVIIPLDQYCWFKKFNQDDFNVEIEWTSASTGTLHVSDLILTEMTFIDGHWWVARMNAASPDSWLVDDEITFVDTQADATAGKIQYNLWRAGLGYLPHATGGAITFTDPV